MTVRGLGWVALTGLCLLGCDTGKGAATGAPTGGKGNANESAGGREGCIEQVSAIAVGDVRAEGKLAARYLELLRGERTAPLTWRVDGSATRITFAVLQADAQWVDSREDPAARGEVARDCTDRVRVEAKFTLRSDDGRLNETFAQTPFEADEAGHLTAWFHRAPAALGGKYVRQGSAGGGTLTNLYFSVSVGPAGFQGDLSEEVTHTDAVGLGPSIASWKLESAPPSSDAAIHDFDASGPPDASTRDAGADDASAPSLADDASISDAGNGRGCYSDEQCASFPGTRCSASTECLSPPGCTPSTGCPAVCYGSCKPAP